ncbi:hypothetical protein FB451DRAFT_1172124 [Mycena latifolia]|nr:hypothetical protein FB451DRAFT_1172124 [Mycena latifolia]
MSIRFVSHARTPLLLRPVVCVTLRCRAGYQGRDGRYNHLGTGYKAIIEAQAELEAIRITLNKRPPAMLVRRKEKGGIAITNALPLTNIDHDDIKGILSEFKVNKCNIAIREPGPTADDLVHGIYLRLGHFQQSLFAGSSASASGPDDSQVLGHYKPFAELRVRTLLR